MGRARGQIVFRGGAQDYKTREVHCEVTKARTCTCIYLMYIGVVKNPVVGREFSFFFFTHLHSGISVSDRKPELPVFTRRN